MSSSSDLPKRLLIITSSGGGGLIQAANAKEQEAKKQDPDLVVIRKDVLKDWMGSIFGKFCSERWNQAQINGDIAALSFFIAAQNAFDYFCWPYFFICALRTLFKEKIDRVIDTQPMGTSAILKAIRIYNHKTKKNIKLEKILVDLPTKAATHFFKPIRRLTKKDRPHLRLSTIHPLLEEGETKEQFWQKNCKLSEQEISYEDMYVRQAFREPQYKTSNTMDFSLFIRYKTKEELRLIQKTYSRGDIQPRLELDNTIHFFIPQNARVITILLGSQPSNEATFNYVKKFVQILREPNVLKTPCYLFVFCSELVTGKMTLFQKIADFVDRAKNYPKHLSIVPFSFQLDDVIAPLFYRSNLTCTRSGGQTAMELMAVSSGEIWIHSETKKDLLKKEDPSLEELLKGIPGWEAANALYLKNVKNAKIMTPEIFGATARKLLK